MKLETISLVALSSCTAAAAVLAPRQLPNLNIPGLPTMAQIMNLKAKKALKIEDMKPVLPREGSKRTRLVYGPFILKPAGSNEDYGNYASMDPAGTGNAFYADTDFLRDMTILTTNMTVVFEDGSRAGIDRSVYTHHLVGMDLMKITAVAFNCGGPQIARNPVSIFMGAEEGRGGSMYTTPDAKFNSGYYVGKNDWVMIASDIVNYQTMPQTVYVNAEIEYVPGRIPGNLETSVQVVNVGMCDGKGLDVRPPEGQKKFSVTGKEVLVATDGHLVTSLGHLHDGGVNLKMKINGKEICDSRAEYGPAIKSVGGKGSNGNHGHGRHIANEEYKSIASMSYCYGPVEVRKGDKVLLEAFYDLERYPPRAQHDGAMAEEMAVFATFFAEKPVAR